MASTASRPRVRQVQQPAWQPQLVTQFLVDNFGGVSNLASVLEVSKSQPTRWKKSQEVPGLEATRKMVALEAVIRRALTLMTPKMAVIWMDSSNAFLDHARPVDVVVTRGAGEVLQALEAEAQGAFA
jgi:hypothetical protein